MGANQTVANFLDTVALILVKVFGANWRTTIIGFVEAGAIVAAPFIMLPEFNWRTHGTLIVIAVLRAWFGTYTKDKSVTGGVNENTVTKEIPPSEKTDSIITKQP